eukprot:gene6707-13595_t
MSGRFSEAMISSKQITPIKLTRGYAPISGSSPWYQIHSWSKEQWSFFTAAIIVVIATIIERFTFKLSADHMSPYRRSIRTNTIIPTTVIQSSLLYLLGAVIQGIGITSTYANYPLNGFLSNIYDGFLCLFGFNPSLDNDHLYSIEDASCPNICWFVIAYVLATVILLQAIDRILKFNDGSLVRILSISIMCSFVFLSLYRIITGTTSSSSSSSSGTEGSQISHSHGLLFSSNDVSIIDIISVIILVLGMELYGRDPEPEIEAITNFSPRKTLTTKVFDKAGRTCQKSCRANGSETIFQDFEEENKGRTTHKPSASQTVLLSNLHILPSWVSQLSGTSSILTLTTERLLNTSNRPKIAYPLRLTLYFNLACPRSEIGCALRPILHRGLSPFGEELFFVILMELHMMEDTVCYTLFVGFHYPSRSDQGDNTGEEWDSAAEEGDQGGPTTAHHVKTAT